MSYSKAFLEELDELRWDFSNFFNLDVLLINAFDHENDEF